ncbi:UPF0307 protein [Tanacetum coccineum]
MSHLLRPLILSPSSSTWHLCRYLTTHPPLLTHPSFHHTHLRTLHVSKSRGLRPADAPAPEQTDSETEDERKSRNEKKREAKRGVKWAMDLALFNDLQIKRILRSLEDVLSLPGARSLAECPSAPNRGTGSRAVSLEKEVFDAVMLVKRLGRDVREGKRRQFSYIGRLLRDVEPELIDGLIKATKDGDMQKFQEFLGSDKSDLAEVSEEEEESEDEDEGQGYGHSHDIATKWFNGLVNKDADITSEIYSLSTVDFDRQELRKLVRNFCSLQDRNATPVESEGETKLDKKLLRAEKHLNRFLVSLAKRLPSEEDYIL